VSKSAKGRGDKGCVGLGGTGFADNEIPCFCYQDNVHIGLWQYFIMQITDNEFEALFYYEDNR
jgi:hypothetical protein